MHTEALWDGELVWRRAAALAVDFIPVAILITAITAASGYAALGSSGSHPSGATATLIGLASIALYVPVVLKLTRGRTLGKRLLGLRVVGPDGEPPGFWRAVWREVILKVLLLGYLLSRGGVWAGVGLVTVILDPAWMYRDKRGRALHDLLAGTEVIRA